MLCERCGLNFKRSYLNPCPKCLVMLCAGCEEHHSCDIQDTVIDDPELDNEDDRMLLVTLHKETTGEEPEIDFDGYAEEIYETEKEFN